MKFIESIIQKFTSSKTSVSNVTSSYLDDLKIDSHKFSVFDSNKIVSLMRAIEDLNSSEIKFGYNSEVLDTYFNKFKLSPELIDFYSNFHFTESLNVHGITIYSLKRLEEENTDYVPSCYIAEIGYITFGGFGNGDALCVKVDDDETTVYEASHDEIYEDTPKEDIPTHLKPVGRSLLEVLELAMNEKLY